MKRLILFVLLVLAGCAQTHEFSQQEWDMLRARGYSAIGGHTWKLDGMANQMYHLRGGSYQVDIARNKKDGWWWYRAHIWQHPKCGKVKVHDLGNMSSLAEALYCIDHTISQFEGNASLYKPIGEAHAR